MRIIAIKLWFCFGLGSISADLMVSYLLPSGEFSIVSNVDVTVPCFTLPFILFTSQEILLVEIWISQCINDVCLATDSELTQGRGRRIHHNSGISSWMWSVRSNLHLYVGFFKSCPLSMCTFVQWQMYHFFISRRGSWEQKIGKYPLFIICHLFRDTYCLVEFGPRRSKANDRKPVMLINFYYEVKRNANREQKIVFFACTYMTLCSSLNRNKEKGVD